MRDLRVNDLHYADVAFYASGHNTSSAYSRDADGICRTIHTEPMPKSEVERVAPDESISGVVFGMEALAEKARESGAALLLLCRIFPQFTRRGSRASAASFPTSAAHPRAARPQRN